MHRSAAATAGGLTVVSASTKEQPFTARRPPAGIARGGDLPMVDSQNGRLVPVGDLRCGVAGRIVYYDDFIRLAHDVGGVMDRLQRPAKARLFIVRWNDE